MSNADQIKYLKMDEQLQAMSEKQGPYIVNNTSSSLPFNYSSFAQSGTTYVPPQQSFVSGTVTMLATLTEAEKDNIRKIVAEEIAKVLPVPQKKPEVGIPDCPDCGGWVLEEHDVLTPLNTAYRRWWCVCPEKVAEWEARCQQGLDDLLAAIHDPDDEIEAVLLELGPKAFDEMVARVRERMKVETESTMDLDAGKPSILP